MEWSKGSTVKINKGTEEGIKTHHLERSDKLWISEWTIDNISYNGDSSKRIQSEVSSRLRRDSVTPIRIFVSKTKKIALERDERAIQSWKTAKGAGYKKSAERGI